MAKVRNNISKSRKTTKLQHAFRNVREPLVLDITSKTVMVLTTPSGSGNATIFATLSPSGLKGVNLNAGIFQSTLIDNPHLLWLYSTAGNFGMFRVTRAKLIFVGSQGTTATGIINLFGSRDVIDCGTGINTAYMQGPGSKTYDLANAGTKEISLNIPVDSSWKKVSAVVSCPADTAPLRGTTSGFANVNSVGDLCFGGIAAQVTGAAANSTVGSLFVDYDIEFKDPMSVTLNA